MAVGWEENDRLRERLGSENNSQLANVPSTRTYTWTAIERADRIRRLGTNRGAAVLVPQAQCLHKAG